MIVKKLELCWVDVNTFSYPYCVAKVVPLSLDHLEIFLRLLILKAEIAKILFIEFSCRFLFQKLLAKNFQ